MDLPNFCLKYTENRVYKVYNFSINKKFNKSILCLRVLSYEPVVWSKIDSDSKIRGF